MGIVITLRVKNNIHNKGSAYIPDGASYTGNIVPNPKWLDDDHICLTTGEPWFPVRMIQKAHIVSSSTSVVYNKPKTDRNVFEVRGSKGNTYTITRENTIWSCTCVGFGFRRECKHIAAAKKLLNK